MSADTVLEGRVAGLCQTAYRSHPGLSSTTARALLGGTVKHALLTLEQSQPTPAMRLGTALHCSVLEPHQYWRSIAILPESIDRRTKVGKAEYESFVAAHASHTIITSEQQQIVDCMQQSISECKTASQILSIATEREVSMFHRSDRVMVAPLKARIDAIASGHGWLVDIKTTSGLASRSEFQRSIGSFGYGYQAAHYRVVARGCGLTVNGFIFIVIETNPPHGVAVYCLKDDVIDLYEGRVIDAAKRWFAYLQDSIETGYEDQIQEIGVPAWEIKTLQETSL